MGYSCGSCGVDFPSKRGIVEHMIDVHNSPYLEGDEAMIKHSRAYATAKGKAEIVKKMDEVI